MDRVGVSSGGAVPCLWFYGTSLALPVSMATLPPEFQRLRSVFPSEQSRSMALT